MVSCMVREVTTTTYRLITTVVLEVPVKFKFQVQVYFFPQKKIVTKIVKKKNNDKIKVANKPIRNHKAF